MMSEAKEDAPPTPVAEKTDKAEKKAVMPGLEGGSEPQRQSGSFLATIAGFFKDVRVEAAMAGQDFEERTNKPLSPDAVDYVERLARFKEISRDQVKLQTAAVALSAALARAASSHETLGVRYMHEAKVFADTSSAPSGVQDGVVNSQLSLESPKDGHETDLLADAARRQERMAAVLKRLMSTVDEFSKSITLFNDKVLVDLEDSVKTYRKHRLLLDAAKPVDDLPGLKANCDKAKESVDVKLLLVTEKRFRDLQNMAHALQEALIAFVTESKSAFLESK